MPVTLQELTAAHRTVIADGGMGTMLFSLGLERGSAPELWNVDKPDAVRSVHAGYIAAGSQIILTNTFGGNRGRLQMHGLEDRVDELNQAAVRLVRAEVDRARHPVVIAGSMGPTGSMLAPLGELAFDDAVTIFAEQAAALVAGGIDVLWIETMADLEEVRAAVEGCRRAAPGFPIVATMTFDTKGRTMMGTTPEQALAALREFGVVALGANCGRGPDELEAVIEKMHAVDPAAVLVAKANAGLPKMVNGEAVYDATPDVMADYALRVREKGAWIIGACCGSTPDHIKAMAAALGKSN